MARFLYPAFCVLLVSAASAVSPSGPLNPTAPTPPKAPGLLSRIVSTIKTDAYADFKDIAGRICNADYGLKPACLTGHPSYADRANKCWVTPSDVPVLITGPVPPTMKSRYWITGDPCHSDKPHRIFCETTVVINAPCDIVNSIFLLPMDKWYGGIATGWVGNADGSVTAGRYNPGGKFGVAVEVRRGKTVGTATGGYQYIGSLKGDVNGQTQFTMEPVRGNPKQCLVTNRINNGFMLTQIPVLTPHLFTIVHLALDEGRRFGNLGSGLAHLKAMAEAKAQGKPMPSQVPNTGK